MKTLLHTKALIKKENVSSETGVVDAVVGSTAVIDRMGDIIEQDGWDLSDFKSNPVILWGHNVREEKPPIGRALKVWIENKGKKDAKLMFKIQFDLQDSFAAEIFRKIKDGFLNTVSVGFIPSEWEQLDPDDWFSGLRYLKQQLLELSVVPVPANPEALMGLRSFMKKNKLKGAPVEKIDDLYETPTKKEMEEMLEMEPENKDDKDEETKEEADTVKDTEEVKEEENKAVVDKDKAEDELTDDSDFIDSTVGEFKSTMSEIWKNGYTDESKAIEIPADTTKVKSMTMGQCKALLESCFLDMRPVEDEKTIEPDSIKNMKTILEAITKSGRVLSAKNENKLRQAIDLLNTVLAALEKQPEEDDSSKDIEVEASKNVLPYTDLGIEPEAEEWDGPGEVAKSEIDDLKIICALHDNEKPENKSSYKLAHHKAKSHKAVWRGIASAMASLLGAKGGIEMSDEERKDVYNHLVEHYKEFNKEAPEFKMVEDQVLAGFSEEIQAVVLEREEKHMVRLIKKVLENQKAEKKAVESNPKVVSALKILNQALSKINPTEGGAK